MPLLTFLYGSLMVLLGLLFFWKTTSGSPTPLIPSVFGVAMIACAVAAFKVKWRMHAMHTAVLLALLAIVGSLFPLKTIFAEKVSIPKVLEALLMLALSVAYLVMGVRSFFAARRAGTRRQGDTVTR